VERDSSLSFVCYFFLAGCGFVWRVLYGFGNVFCGFRDFFDSLFLCKVGACVAEIT
jgi:hypothetical protein